MLKELIDFFENAPLEEITSELKKYNIEFVENNVDKYNNFLSKTQMSISKASYNARVNSKLTYKKIDKVNISYKINCDSMNKMYSESGIGDAA